MEKKSYNVLAVYSLLNRAGREHFSGILDAMSEKRSWHLSTVRPGRFFTEKDFVNENGDPFDGFILTLPGTDKAMEMLAKSHKPTILVNITDRRLCARTSAVSAVWLDNADVGRCAARHLLERGKYMSAGYVHEFCRPFWSEERMMAFRQAMRHGGCETSVFDDGPDFQSRLRRWVCDLPKPAAVMACSDMRAADVIKACRAEGIAVPAQVAVIGVDNDSAEHERCGMGISSVDNNMRLMGNRAVRELAFLFQHPKWKGRPHEVLIPVSQVITRESTARQDIGAQLVSTALSFIAANRMHRLSPADVVSQLGCSRQLADLRFVQSTGTTIHKAIEKARMEEVQRRILSGRSVNDIVKSMQFTSANQLYRIYKRHFGHTIRQTDL